MGSGTGNVGDRCEQSRYGAHTPGSSSGSEGGHGKPTAATPHGAHDPPYPRGFYTVWGQALALVYGGQAQAARHLLSVAYPGLHTRTYGHLWQRMQRHLRSSPYYRSLLTMNGGKI